MSFPVACLVRCFQSFQGHRSEERFGQANRQLDELTAQQTQQSQRFAAINQGLAEAITAQEEVAQEVQQRLQEDDEFVRLSDRAAVAEAALERAEANLEEIDQDAVRKLPAYEASTLFRYLYDRGFDGEVAVDAQAVAVVVG